MNERQIKNKWITLGSSLLLLGVSGYFAYYLNSDIENDFKRDIYSVTLTGEVERKNVETLESAILTSTTISTSLKKTVAQIETISLENVDGYLERIRPLFDKEFFKTFSKDQEAKSKFYLESDIRVLSFVVTEAPILVGVDVSQPNPHWLFYIKGQYMREGMFEKRSDESTFGESEIWVTVKESVGENGNPAGIKIVNYEQ